MNTIRPVRRPGVVGVLNFSMRGIHLYAKAFAFAAMGGVLGLLALGAPIRFRVAKSPPTPRAVLIEESSSFRPFAPRLVGGFTYAIVDPSRIQPTPSTRRSLRQALSREASTLSPRQLADVAVMNLWYGRLEAPIQLLEELVARFPESSSFLNDLAVAYMARAEAENRPFDNLHALAILDKVVARGNPAPEPLFNRALVLQRLFLAERAKRAWRLYQESETDEEWRLEAKHRAEEIKAFGGREWLFVSEDLVATLKEADPQKVRAIVTAHPQAVRRFLEDERLPYWAGLYLEERFPDSERALQESGLVASLITSFSGDRLPEDTVQRLAEGAVEENREAARGFLEYSLGRKLYSQGDYSGAIVRFRKAEKLLARTRSPFALRASYNLANCNHYLSKGSLALERYAALAAQAEPAGYRSLLGEILWMKGLALFTDRNIEPAKEAYSKALRTFEQTKEVENIAGAHVLLAETFDHQGDPGQAWRHRLAALATVRRVGDAQRRYQVYSVAAIAASRSEFPKIALYFQEAALQDARRLDSPLAVTQALFWKAKYEFQGSDAEAAAGDLRHADTALLNLPPSAIKERTEAEILLVRARLLTPEAPQSAVELLDRAIELYARGGHRTNLIEMLIARAEAFSKLGRLAEAEHDLETAAGWIESWRLRFKTPAERTLFMEQWRSLFEAIVLLRLEKQGNVGAALEAIEKARSKTLLEQLGDRPRPWNSRREGEIWRALPRHTIAVSYFRTGPYLRVFVVSREGVQVTTILERWDKIQEVISAFRAGLEGHASAVEIKKQAEWLYKVLIAPLEKNLDTNAHLVVNPDGVLYKIPFAALRNPRTKRYLVQDHALTIAPSIKAYVECLDKYQTLLYEEERLLIVNNPKFNRDRFPGLSSLGSANEEADMVAAAYLNVTEIGGEAATIENFLDHLNNSNVVQFIGHAGGGSDPFLLFAEDEKGSGTLRASDIEGLRIEGVRLVVLTACETGDGGILKGEGVESLGRGFVAAGVPAVVETKWRLADSRSAEFSSRFHQELHCLANPALAFRAAQLSLLDEGRDESAIRLWSSFQFYGGTY